VSAHRTLRSAKSRRRPNAHPLNGRTGLDGFLILNSGSIRYLIYLVPMGCCRLRRTCPSIPLRMFTAQAIASWMIVLRR
jgi:hypothetical protein